MMSEADRNEHVRPKVVAEAQLLGVVLLSILSALGSVLIGYLAYQTGKVYAPMLVFPLAVGLLCGGLIVGLCWAFGLNRRATIVAAALFGALLAVICQHALFYRQHVEVARNRKPTVGAALDEETLAAQKELLRPPTISEFFSGRNWQTYFKWSGNGLLTLIGAAGIAFFAPLPHSRFGAAQELP